MAVENRCPGNKLGRNPGGRGPAAASFSSGNGQRSPQKHYRHLCTKRKQDTRTHNCAGGGYMRTGQLLIATSTDLSVPEGDKGFSRMLSLSHHQSLNKQKTKQNTKQKSNKTKRGKTDENNSPYNVLVLFCKSPILFSLITPTSKKIISNMVHICKSDLTL